MCSVDRASLPRVLSLLEGLLPAAAANAPHTAQYWDLWHRLLSTPRAAQVAHSGADALRALVTAHLEPEPTKDKMPLGGTPGRMPPRGSRVAAGGEAGSSVEAESIVGPLRLLATQVSPTHARSFYPFHTLRRLPLKVPCWCPKADMSVHLGGTNRVIARAWADAARPGDKPHAHAHAHAGSPVSIT
jgi:hypothetical protein